MASPATRRRDLTTSSPQDQARVGSGDNLVTIVMGSWLMVGLFVDGWAHSNLASTLETFFTPWHALFYSGFVATGLWVSWLILREARRGRVGLAAIPVGYELGVVGLIVFGLGGVGDMLWHTIFGIEVNTEALLSPTHLVLLLGAELIVTSPLRSAWASTDASGDAPSLRAFLPTLLSVLVALSFASFLSVYLWAFNNVSHGRAAMDFFAGNSELLTEFATNRNLVNILMTNLMLLAPVLFMLRRWRLPFGSVALLFGVNTFLMNAVHDPFDRLERPLTALAAGLVADLLIRAWRPGPGRVLAWRAFAVAVPLVLWGLHFLATALVNGEGFSVELWAGITVMAGLNGLVLSVLMLPPALPARGRATTAND